ncbi:unnamed protein product [Acanthoscelides obtectus]|uniref:Uncharacterized protein n=1 Tax=Acanthoscelides obtectus TaxID=200917 RepID=A0A9P0P8I0_ACAOB|nr:unnamed protein product [Acanthoscelides obtectus]CAK1674896.1 hypothetical protein AOBTE_LOCUS29802 [Acanthoscelides obtectus]
MYVVTYDIFCGLWRCLNLRCLFARAIVSADPRGLVFSKRSCLSYGHACWGGHGKRSDSSHISSTRRDADMSMLPRWYLSRLIQKPLNRRYIFGSSSNDFNANEMLSDGSDIKSQEYLGSNEIIEDQNPDVADILENDGQHRMLEKRALGHH